MPKDVWRDAKEFRSISSSSLERISKKSQNTQNGQFSSHFERCLRIKWSNWPESFCILIGIFWQKFRVSTWGTLVKIKNPHFPFSEKNPFSIVNSYNKVELKKITKHNLRRGFPLRGDTVLWKWFPHLARSAPPPPLLRPGTPPKNFFSCMGYQVVYNCLIYGIFLLVQNCKMFSNTLSSNNHKIHNAIPSHCRDGISKHLKDPPPEWSS